MPTWVTVASSAIGFLVTLFVALFAWRIQLIGKRRTEIAEEMLLAFSLAVDAIELVRSPASFLNEAEEVRLEIGADKEKHLPGEHFYIALSRLRKNNERFSTLRRFQLLGKYHFGSEADAAFKDLEQAIRKIRVAARMGILTAHRANQVYRDEAAAEAAYARQQGWENAIWEGAGDADEIGTLVTSALGSKPIQV